MAAQLSTDLLLGVLLGSVRAAAWLLVCPPFNSRLIPGQVKALLSLCLAVPVAPTLARQAPPLTAPALVVSTAQQVMIGFALGFVTALLFAAVQAAGDMIDLFGGFVLAFAYDPLSATATSVFGRFYNLTAVCLLFATDGHRMVLAGFMRSYQVLPLDSALSLSNLDRMLTRGLSGMFLSALQIAGPLIAVLFCADVALGLLNRMAPALNAFSMGFPAKILLTLLGSALAISLLPAAVARLVDQAVRAVVAVAGG